MFLLETDCTIYKADGEFLSTDICTKLTSKTFEEYDVKALNERIVKVVFSWLDPLKIRDKLGIKEQKEVVLWFFIKEKILVTWCSSEESVGHVLRKIENRLHVRFEKINIFDRAKNPLNFNTFAQLSSIHILNNELMSFEEDDAFNFDKKISFQTVSNEEYNDYIDKSLITSLTFKNLNKHFYFYVDKESIVSFPEAMKVADVINVLEKIIKKSK
ncbi:hypothetical protein [Priestia megaterium]|uniref:hypothetical protein n=1 Tax=Priestia megaterium TaxID=1404 RepID=UPI00221FA5EB|nr:hypothetical protein [Priestia megaterium]UYV50708.1 hypothetical protein OHU65_13970 [Priestia megaterium]